MSQRISKSYERYKIMQRYTNDVKISAVHMNMDTEIGQD